MDRACLETLEDFDTMSNSLASLRNSLSFAEFSALRQSGDNERVALPLVAVEVESASESASAAVSANFAWTLSAYALIIVLSLAGNVLVMLAIVLNRCMHTSRHYLVFNLAVCHLTLLVACVWVDMVKSVNDYWPLGSFVCKLNAFAQIASVVASTLTLVLIAVAQIRATLNPPSRMSPVSPRPTTRQATRTLRWIGLVWLVSACVAVPSFAYRRYSERHWSDFVETFCDDSGWPVLLVTNTHNGCTSISRAHKRLYRTLLVTFLFLVPFAAVCVAYLLALAKMWTTSVNDYYVAATVELSIDARDDNDHEDTSNQQSSEKKVFKPNTKCHNYPCFYFKFAF